MPGAPPNAPYAGPPPGMPMPLYTGPPPSMPGSGMGLPPPPGGMPQDGGWAARTQLQNEKATTLFVGSIPAGVTDRWLKMLFEACGFIASYNRPNKAFCFIEFLEPDSVLRALTTLNDLELPGLPLTEDNPPKKLKVKADAKTGKFLDEYKSHRDGANDAMLDAEAQEKIQQVVRNMRDPNFSLPGDPADGKAAYETPAHLKDLTEEELPEEVRGSVLGEIAQFRVTATVREEDKRRQEVERAKLQAERAREARQQNQQRPQNGTGSFSGHAPPNGPRAVGDGPQSYLNAPHFASAAAGGKDLDPEERDELEEQTRRQADERRRKMDAELVSDVTVCAHITYLCCESADD